MTHPDYTLEATSDLPGVAFSAMRQIILAQAKAGQLEVLDDETDRLTVKTAHGLIGLRPGQSAETAGMVAANDQRWLFVMKNAVLMQMKHLMPEVAENMRWSDGDYAGALPPNFQFVRVKEVTQLGPVFLRAKLEGEDLSSHTIASIHFRLVQPPKDVEPQWPSLAPNGSTKWPDEPFTLHRPVYTTRSIDYDTNTLLTDIYIHDGGRTTDWAKEVMGGDRGRRVVGLMGPSGGGVIDADSVLMASDETGFPAAARILENLPEGATGTVYLEAEHGAECEYPVEAPPGVSIEWLARAKGEKLVDATLAAMPAPGETKVWYAGERSDAREVREAAKAAGWEPHSLRVSGFWRRPEG